MLLNGVNTKVERKEEESAERRVWQLEQSAEMSVASKERREECGLWTVAGRRLLCNCPKFMAFIAIDSDNWLRIILAISQQESLLCRRRCAVAAVADFMQMQQQQQRLTVLCLRLNDVKHVCIIYH